MNGNPTTECIEELDKLFHPNNSSSQSTLPQKKRKRACLECTKSHSSCDGQRPCSSCKSKNKTQLCVDVLKKKYLKSHGIQTLKPLIPKPNPTNIIYPPSFSLPCAYASKEDAKCFNCQKSKLILPKTNSSSLFNQDFSVHLEQTLDLPNCFGLSDMWLNSEVPLWMKSLNPLESCQALTQLHSQVEDACSALIVNDIFPSLDSTVLEYSRVIRLLPNPSAVWTLPDGFLKVSNSSFTQISSFEMIQHCIHPDSLEPFYQSLLDCVSEQVSTGQIVFINNKRATVQFSLRMTCISPCIFGNFIITDSLS